jgi:hypothetical protein
VHMQVTSFALETMFADCESKINFYNKMCTCFLDYDCDNLFVDLESPYAVIASIWSALYATYTSNPEIVMYFTNFEKNLRCPTIMPEVKWWYLQCSHEVYQMNIVLNRFWDSLQDLPSLEQFISLTADTDISTEVNIRRSITTVKLTNLPTLDSNLLNFWLTDCQSQLLEASPTQDSFNLEHRSARNVTSIDKMNSLVDSFAVTPLQETMNVVEQTLLPTHYNERYRPITDEYATSFNKTSSVQSGNPLTALGDRQVEFPNCIKALEEVHLQTQTADVSEPSTIKDDSIRGPQRLPADLLMNRVAHPNVPHSNLDFATRTKQAFHTIFKMPPKAGEVTLSVLDTSEQVSVMNETFEFKASDIISSWNTGKKS